MTVAIFDGDSFTNDPRIPTAQQYPALVGASLGITINNVAVGGSVSDDMVARLPANVALNPDIVFAQMPINDFNHAITYGQSNKDTISHLLANFATMRAAFTGKQFKIIAPNINSRLNEALRMYEAREHVALFCKQNDCQFIDFWDRMARYAGTVSAATFDTLYIPGDYHPSVAAHALHADFIVSQLAAPSLVSGPSVQTAWSRTLTLDSTPNANACMRSETKLTAGGTQVRARWRASLAHGGLTITRASVGLQSSGANTAASPVPATFGGMNGIAKAQGESQWCDWIDFTTSAGQTLIWNTDCGSVGDTLYAHPSGETGKTYYKSSTSGFDQATVTGFQTDSGYVYPIDAVEVR